MARVAWEDLELVEARINQKTGRPYRQRYLAPSYFLELYLQVTPLEALARFYRAALDALAPRLRYHHTDQKGREARIRDVAAAHAYFADFLASPRRYAWTSLADVGGVGSATEVGGVGSARFEAWIHKTDAAEAERQVAEYRANASHFGAAMLPMGPRISRVQVCFPLDHFASPAAFAEWVLRSSLVAEARFFSGSAGYKLHYYRGYDSPTARQRLSALLHELPGLDFDVELGNAIGRVLDPDGTGLVPVVRRVSWLTMVSAEGLASRGPTGTVAEALGRVDGARVHALAHGACAQAGPEPALARDDPRLATSFEISRAVRPLWFAAHPRDHYGAPSDADAKRWLYYFQAPLPHLEAQP